MTVTWEDCEFYDRSDNNSITRQQTSFIDKLQLWLRLRFPSACIWVRERVPGRGLHTHFMLHLGPKPHEIAAGLKHYLSQAFRFADNGIKITHSRAGFNSPIIRADRFRYLLKGINPEATYKARAEPPRRIADALGIDTKPQGRITIQRAGTSANIAISAREKRGWVEVNELDDLAPILHPDWPVTSITAVRRKVRERSGIDVPFTRLAPKPRPIFFPPKEPERR